MRGVSEQDRGSGRPPFLSIAEPGVRTLLSAQRPETPPRVPGPRRGDPASPRARQGGPAPIPGCTAARPLPAVPPPLGPGPLPPRGREAGTRRRLASVASLSLAGNPGGGGGGGERHPSRRRLALPEPPEEGKSERTAGAACRRQSPQVPP